MQYSILKINEKTINGRIYDMKIAKQIVEKINGGKIMVKNGPDYTSDTIGYCQSAKINDDKIICEVSLLDDYIRELIENKHGALKICGMGDVNRNKVRNYELTHLTTSFPE